MDSNNDYPDKKYSNLKFHYNREERLAKSFANTHNLGKKDCFFCAKNRFVILTILNMALLFIVFSVYLHLIGKSAKIILRGMEYSVSKTTVNNKMTHNFTIQIRRSALSI
jgi:hypothetical protein